MCFVSEPFWQLYIKYSHDPTTEHDKQKRLMTGLLKSLVIKCPKLERCALYERWLTLVLLESYHNYLKCLRSCIHIHIGVQLCVCVCVDIEEVGKAALRGPQIEILSVKYVYH